MGREVVELDIELEAIQLEAINVAGVEVIIPVSIFILFFRRRGGSVAIAGGFFGGLLLIGLDVFINIFKPDILVLGAGSGNSNRVLRLFFIVKSKEEFAGFMAATIVRRLLGSVSVMCAKSIGVDIAIALNIKKTIMEFLTFRLLVLVEVSRATWVAGEGIEPSRAAIRVKRGISAFSGLLLRLFGWLGSLFQLIGESKDGFLVKILNEVALFSMIDKHLCGCVASIGGKGSHILL